MSASQLTSGSAQTGELASLEWTMFSEMDVAEMSFSFFTSFLVVALIPLVLLLIYKSEDKQARYSRLQ